MEDSSPFSGNPKEDEERTEQIANGLLNDYIDRIDGEVRFERYVERHIPLVEIWVDGGCEPNPGFGAWGAVLKHNGHTKEVSGTEESSTNQRAEILAAIGALAALKTPCKVKIMSDSQYLIGTMSSGWRRRANLDLWQALDIACEGHDVEWIKIKAHQGGNIRPHALVMMALKRRTVS